MAIGTSPASRPQSDASAESAKWKVQWLLGVQFAAMFVALGYVIGTDPFYTARDVDEKAGSFVKTLYPDRAVRGDSPYANIAVVLNLIRSGDNKAARTAIDFAADLNLFCASPYAIERLQSEDAALRQSAHSLLVQVAGKDYGPSTQGWWPWWYNPPRPVLRMGPVGQHTVEAAAPVVIFLLGLLLWAVGGLIHGSKGRSPWLSWPRAYVMLVPPAWMAIVLTCDRLSAWHKSCTFGSETIRYYTYHAPRGPLLEGTPYGSAILLWGLSWLGLCFIPLVVYLLWRRLFRRAAGDIP